MCEEVKVSEEATNVDKHSCNVDEERPDRVVWSKTRGNERYKPCDVNEVQGDGKGYVAVVDPCPKS